MMGLFKALRSLGGMVLDWLAPRRCPFCGKHEPGLLCADCQESLPWAENGDGDCEAVLYYQGAVREALLRYKFESAEHLARPFGLLMAQKFKDMGRQADCVCYVPSSRLRKLKRGFDHSKKLAQSVAAELSLPLLPALQKQRHTRPQTEMASDEERRINAKGTIRVCQNVAGMRVLLCDDVRTSGATIDESREALLRAGAKSVVCLVLARRR